MAEPNTHTGCFGRKVISRNVCSFFTPWDDDEHGVDVIRFLAGVGEQKTDSTTSDLSGI